MLELISQDGIWVWPFKNLNHLGVAQYGNPVPAFGRIDQSETREIQTDAGVVSVDVALTTEYPVKVGDKVLEGYPALETFLPPHREAKEVQRVSRKKTPSGITLYTAEM